MMLPRRPLIHTCQGGLLVEVMIAIGLLAIFASSVFMAIGTEYLSSTGTRQSLDALFLAQEGLEGARAIRDNSWASLTTGTHGIVYSGSNVWSFQSTSDTSDTFTRSLAVTDLTSNERQVVSTVSWRNTSQQIQSVSLATNLTNWRSATPQLLSGDWSNPQTLSSFDLGPGNKGTGLAVKNGIVYMTGAASNASKPDFFIINATNPQIPTLASNLDTGPGLNAVAVTGTFAYLANTDPTNQLQIINVSSTSAPYTVANFRLTGNNAQALSVNVTGSLAIVGTEADAGPELYLVDVSNPSSPLIKSTLEVGADINRINIRNNRAFLATSSSTSEFMVVNISNPNVPVVTTIKNIPGTNPALGLYVNPQDSHAYVTRAYANGASPEVNIYDVTNPDAPSLLGSMEYGSDVNAVNAADNLMFLGTSNSSLEFQTYKVNSPSAPTYYSGLNFPQVANDIALENNIIYIAVRSNDALRIITSQ